ncbi:hypothetical protein BH23BAC1_BH23BAC1_32110 [soil metagenome]
MTGYPTNFIIELMIIKHSALYSPLRSKNNRTNIFHFAVSLFNIFPLNLLPGKNA